MIANDFDQGYERTRARTSGTFISGTNLEFNKFKNTSNLLYDTFPFAVSLQL